MKINSHYTNICCIIQNVKLLKMCEQIHYALCLFISLSTGKLSWTEHYWCAKLLEVMWFFHSAIETGPQWGVRHLKHSMTFIQDVFQLNVIDKH